MSAKSTLFISTAAAVLLLNGKAHATEGGGSVYPLGAENYTCCALPPAGVYGLVWGQHYSADQVRNHQGQVVSSEAFKVDAKAIVPRIIWVTDQEFWGASVALHAILPLVDLDVTVAPGVSDSKSGIGDLTLGAALGWHHSAKWHSLLALDLYAPTGAYDADDIANIGRNHWAVQPVAGLSYIQPEGLNADLKVMWTYNFENDDTGYKGGHELIMDYSLGWAVNERWTLGAGGYLYKQLTDDRQNGQTLNDRKGQAVAFGPSIRYQGKDGWFLTAKYQVESQVENRADGEAFWLKAVFPL